MNKFSLSLKKLFLIATLLLIFFEAFAFSFLANYSGTLRFLNENTINCIRSATFARSSGFKERMGSQWSEMSNETSNLNELISSYINSASESRTPESPEVDFSYLRGNSAEIDNILRASVPTLEGMIEKNNVSGAFIILNTTAESTSAASNNLSSRSGVYLRKSISNGGYSLISGPASITSDKKITKSDMWQKEMLFGDEYNRSFYLMPALYEKKSSVYSPEDFSYWSKPFCLFDGDEKIITCSLPLVGSSGEFYGVLGVEVSAEYISKLFPLGVISMEYADTYVISITIEGAENFFDNPIVTGRYTEDYLRSLTESPSYAYSYDSDNLCNRITDAESDTDLCAFVSNLNVYGSESYFYGTDEWYLIGIANSDVLEQGYKSTTKMLMTALLISILISALLAIIVSSGFSASILKMMNSVKKLDGHSTAILDRINIKEFDELADRLETQNNTLVRYASRTSKIIDLTNTPIATFEISKNSNKVFVSKSIVNLLSLNPALIVNDYIEKREWDYIYENLTVSANMSYEGSFHINKGSDNEKWIKSNTYENDEVIIGVLSDITENVKERLRIEYERDYDSATGIINRRMFFIKAEEILPKGKNAIIALWDIDNIKHVNDLYGHSTGDKLLKAATLVLNSITDDEHIITARLSGDEFVTLISGDKDISEYEKMLEDIYSLLTNVSISISDDVNILIEASVGTACYPKNAKNVKSLLRCADYAIFCDKSAENKRNNGIAKFV